MYAHGKEQPSAVNAADRSARLPLGVSVPAPIADRRARAVVARSRTI